MRGLLLLLFVSSAQAATTTDAFYRVYDDGKTQVISPHLEVKSTVWRDQLTVGAGYTADLVTSASSDVVSYGSRESISENRREFSGQVEAKVPSAGYSMGYIQSDENDYHSKTVSIGGKRELFQKNTVLSLGMANGWDVIQSSANASFRQTMRNQTYSIALTQVLSRKSLIELIYDLRVESGYLASPYRRARVQLDNGTLNLIDENHPRTRNRNAWAVRYNYFFEDWQLATSSIYRLYIDSWDMQSHTIEERFTRPMGTPRLRLSLIARYYWQKQASFYRDFYDSDPGPFYTGNKTLSTHNTITLALAPSWNITDNWMLYGKIEYFKQNFDNHTDIGKAQSTNDDKKLEIQAQNYAIGLSATF